MRTERKKLFQKKRGGPRFTGKALFNRPGRKPSGPLKEKSSTQEEGGNLVGSGNPPYPTPRPLGVSLEGGALIAQNVNQQDCQSPGERRTEDKVSVRSVGKSPPEKEKRTRFGFPGVYQRPTAPENQPFGRTGPSSGTPRPRPQGKPGRSLTRKAP